MKLISEQLNPDIGCKKDLSITHASTRLPMTHIIELQKIPDPQRGFLGVAEYERHLPFVPKRLFYFIRPAANVQRGGHAHREQHQFIIALQGRVTIHAWDKKGTTTTCLNIPTSGLYCAPMTWLELRFDTDDAIAVVLASDIYIEADYIRDHAEFEALLGKL